MNGPQKRSAENSGANKFKALKTSNFSDVENNPNGIEEIQRLVSEAGLAAASEAKAVGMPRVFARGNLIMREFADGRTEIVASPHLRSNKSYFLHKKLGILHARHK
ncbi:MAG TPA: hypothetical protein VFE32_13195 [Puia sp.]|jgi:hypothetical protein|nr:hypothetical protein [Puia sp.]